MASAVFSPPRRVDMMMKNRDAAYKLKNGSPKFKDILRERCRTRVKENRGKFLNLLRNVSDNELQKVLTSTICQEIMDLDDVLKDESNSLFEITNAERIDDALITMNAMQEETLAAEVESVMHTYDMLMANDEALFAELLEDDMEGPPDCLICGVGFMAQSDTRMWCTHCNISVPAHVRWEEVQRRIEQCISAHRMSCPGDPCFTMRESCMYLSCAQCPYSEQVF